MPLDNHFWLMYLIFPTALKLYHPNTQDCSVGTFAPVSGVGTPSVSCPCQGAEVLWTLLAFTFPWWPNPTNGANFTFLVSFLLSISVALSHVQTITFLVFMGFRASQLEFFHSFFHMSSEVKHNLITAFLITLQ